MSSYSKSTHTGYESALERVQELAGKLKSMEAQPRQLTDILEVIKTGGAEICRQFLQDHLDQLCAQEVKNPDGVLGADGKLRRYSRKRDCQVETLFGRVKFQRLAYSDHGLDSVHPLDAQLNLPTMMYSHDLQARVAEDAAIGSYDSTVKEVDAHTGGHVPKRQCEQIVQAVAQDYDEYYKKRWPLDAFERGNAAIVVISIDGKGIVMLPEDLREETRKRAEKSKHRLQFRLSPGEKAGRKRMATVVVVYTIARHKRTPWDIMNKGRDRKGDPKPIQKRVWASLEKTMKEVLDEAIAEAKRLDPNQELTWVFLSDGLEEQLRQINDAIERHGVEATVIQDFVHVLEYLWDAAWCLYEKADPAAELWVQERATEILEGNCTAVAAGIRRAATRRGLSQSAREPMDDCANYLQNNQARLCYDQALENGLPIATGVVEGACRHLVKRRMECSGARWSLEGAEAVLKLRALSMSGDWDDYISFHSHQEQVRNYPERCPEYRPARTISANAVRNQAA